MPGKVDGKGKVRAELEGVSLALVDIEEVAPFIRQRIEQALRRSGLEQLLAPALEDLDRICKSTASAKSQVNGAIDKLMER